VWGARSDGAAQLLLKDSVLARSGVGADGLSAGGSSGARLERCLLAGHARAALGVRDAARVEADLCEFAESPGAAVLHADYPGPDPADPASLHREWPSAVELTRCVVTLGGADALWRGNRPPPPRTNRTRRVPHPVLIGHAASLSQETAGACASTS